MTEIFDVTSKRKDFQSRSLEYYKKMYKHMKDLMTIYIDVDDNEVIQDIKFETFGCGAAIATSSMITEIAKGMTVDEALEITRNDVADALDGLPPIKMHCSNLAADALTEAIKDYKSKKE